MDDQIGPRAAQVREYFGKQVEGGPRELFHQGKGDRRIREGKSPLE